VLGQCQKTVLPRMIQKMEHLRPEVDRDWLFHGLQFHLGQVKTSNMTFATLFSPRPNTHLTLGQEFTISRAILTSKGARA